MDGCLTCYSRPKNELYAFIVKKALEAKAKKSKRKGKKK